MEAIPNQDNPGRRRSGRNIRIPARYVVEEDEPEPAPNPAPEPRRRRAPRAPASRRGRGRPQVAHHVTTAAEFGHHYRHLLDIIKMNYITKFRTWMGFRLPTKRHLIKLELLEPNNIPGVDCPAGVLWVLSLRARTVAAEVRTIFLLGLGHLPPAMDVEPVLEELPVLEALPGDLGLDHPEPIANAPPQNDGDNQQVDHFVVDLNDDADPDVVMIERRLWPWR